MTDVSRLKFLETHEWIETGKPVARVGISDHAQREISDIVFIELPKVGRQVKQRESCMVIESVKAAFDIYAPVAGTITKVNEKLTSEPVLVNQSPYDQGWLFEIQVADVKELDALMTADAYEAHDKHSH